MLSICVRSVYVALVGSLLHFFVNDALTLVIRQNESMLNHIVAELVLKQVCKSYLIWVQRGISNRHIDQALQNRVLVGCRCSFQAVLYHVRAELVEGELYDVLLDCVDDLDLFILKSILQYVSDDVVTVLLWRQIIGRCNDLLNNRLVDIWAREFFKDALDDATAALIFAKLENFSLHKPDDKLNLFGREVQNDALHDVVALLAEHHFHEHLLVKLGDDLLLLFDGQADESLLDDSAAKRVKRQAHALLEHRLIELVDPLGRPLFKEQLDDVVAKHVLHQAAR